MSKLYSSHKRFIGLGLMSAFVIALAVLGTLWGFSQMASAAPDVTLVHLNPDGTDYTGNPYCPQTVWSADGKTATPDARHDCNNIAGQQHVIRTDGYDPSLGTGVFTKDGVGTLVEGDCDAILAGKLGWSDDDGDGLADEDGENEGVDDDDDATEDGLGAVPGSGNCDDGLDNDLDTFVDAADPDCAALIDEDQTADGTDDDDDGTEDGLGAAPGSGNCSDGLDNDGDGTDANDAQCAAFIDEDPGGDANNDGCPGICGVDDDGDTVADEPPVFDDDEDGLTDEDPIDGIDNDNDGTEDGVGAVPGMGNCGNTLDDDGDGTDLAADAECAAFDGEDPIDFDDDGDTVADEDPVGNVLLADEKCAVLRSIVPGETNVIFSYDGASTDAIHKEWDKLEDTVILKKDDVDKKLTVEGMGKVELPLDENGNDKRDPEDAHLLDRDGETQDHGVIWDEANKEYKSEEGPIRLIEVVHGYHAEMPDHPTEGAVVLAFIDSPGCSYFTNPVPVVIGLDAYQAGELNLGTALVGITDWRGFSIGPKVWPSGAQISAEAQAEATAHGLLVGDSTNSAVAPGTFEADYASVYVDTDCAEQATITFKVGYPDYVQSVPEIPEIEQVTINWTKVQAAKQPQIRWAGEEIVLEKRWAPSGDWYPEAGGIDDDLDGKVNEDTGDASTDDQDGDGLADEDPKDGNDNDGDQLEDGTRGDPGDFECTDGIDNDGDGDIDGLDDNCLAGPGIDEDVPDDDKDGLVDEDPLDFCPLQDFLVKYIKLDGPGGLVSGLPDAFYPFASEPEAVWTYIDEECVSRALYSSEEPGKVDVEAILFDPTTYEQVDNKHAFLVWYIKMYQLKLTNVPGEREDHNAGKFAVADGADLYDPSVGDVVAETLNVSADALLRVRVKGWFYGGNPSGRPDICIDMDGDGNGLEGDEATPPGEPYTGDTTHTGCTDDDDEMLAGGYWVLPDDMEKLAGFHPDHIPSWDVMSEPNVAAKNIIGPKSTLDSHDDTTRQVVPCVQLKDGAADWTCTRKTIDPDGKITEADALMPPLKVLVELEAEDAGFLKPVVDKSADVGIDSAYQSVMIPANRDIPTPINNGGYDWNSWGWSGVYQFDYPFFLELSKTTEPEQGLIRSFHFYTDNRGEGFFFANGDYNLTYDDCRTVGLYGTPDCSPLDVVGESNITVIGDYPYFRGHRDVKSNPVTKTWTWGGFKSVTIDPQDPNHTLVIAHLLDRDGYCKNEVDVGKDPMEVQFSPSLHPVEGEEITFEIVNGIGHILSADLDGISPNAKFSVEPSPLVEATVSGWEDGVWINAEKAVARAEHEELLEAFGQGADRVKEGECQAWVLIEHPMGAQLEISVLFDDPEGRITRHWPPTELEVDLVQGWNDSCYVDEEATVEEAMAGFIDDVLAVYRYNADQSWDRHFPGQCEDDETLCTIEALSSYDQLFILMGASATWTQLITAPLVDVDLVPAWNSVCYAGVDKLTEDATRDIETAFAIMYTLGTDQAWRRYVPDRPDIPNTLPTLHQFDSVILLVTAEGPITWRFDP